MIRNRPPRSEVERKGAKWLLAGRQYHCIRILLIALIFPSASLATSRAETTLAADWVNSLHDRDPARRQRASYVYSWFNEDKNQSLLVLSHALHDQDPFVREHVAAALGEWRSGSPEVVALLIQELTDQDPAVQSQVALALAKHGREAAGPLVESLMTVGAFKDPAQQSRLWEDYAASAIVMMQENAAPAIAAALSKLLEEDPLVETRKQPLGGDAFRYAYFMHLASEMGPLADRIISDELLQRALSVTPGRALALRLVALKLLKKGGQRDFVDPDSTRTVRLSKQIASLGIFTSDTTYGYRELGDLSISLVQDLFAAKQKDAALNLMADVIPAGRVIEPWTQLIEQALKSNDKETRLFAMYWLGRHDYTRIPISEGILLELTRSPNPLEAVTGAGYWARLGGQNPAIAEALIRVLTLPNLDGSFAQDAIITLGQLGAAGRSAVPILRKYAGKPSKESVWDTHDRAIEALEEINGARSAKKSTSNAKEARAPDEREVPALAAAAYIGDSMSRCKAMENLSLFPANTQARKAVAGALNDEDEHVSKCAEKLFEIFIIPQLKPSNLESYLENHQDTLPRRELASVFLSPEMNRPYRLTPNDRADLVLKMIYGANQADFDQGTLSFSILIDYRVFKLIQDKVAALAEERLELANPAFPLLVGGAEPETVQNPLPRWPWTWPPPRYTSWGVLTLNSLPPEPTIGAVFDRLTSALELNGYDDNRLYGIVGDGVAVVCHLEQVDQDGHQLAGTDRWTQDPPTFGHLSALQFATDVFMGIRADYRLFMFFITKVADISGGTAEMSFQSAQNPVVDGGRVLPEELKGIPWSGYYLHVVSYRFHKQNGAVTFVSNDVPTGSQLQSAGISFALQRRP
jgi:HEAT repeats